MALAQFTLTYACAAINLQFVRSSTYIKPFLFAWIITFRRCPADLDIGEYVLVSAVYVVNIIGYVLVTQQAISPVFGPDRQHAGRIQTVEPASRVA